MHTTIIDILFVPHGRPGRNGTHLGPCRRLRTKPWGTVWQITVARCAASTLAVSMMSSTNTLAAATNCGSSTDSCVTVMARLAYDGVGPRRMVMECSLRGPHATRCVRTATEKFGAFARGQTESSDLSNVANTAERIEYRKSIIHRLILRYYLIRNNIPLTGAFYMYTRTRRISYLRLNTLWWRSVCTSSLTRVVVRPVIVPRTRNKTR